MEPKEQRTNISRHLYTAPDVQSGSIITRTEEQKTKAIVVLGIRCNVKEL
jgi:hypothetical protein